LSSGGGIGLDLDGIRRELADQAGRLKPLGLGRVVAGAGAVDGLAEVVAALARAGASESPSERAGPGQPAPGSALPRTGNGLPPPGGATVVVLAAATPMSVDGRDLRAAVEQALDRSFAVDWVVVGPDDGQVHADEATVAAATAAAAGAGCVVTVGSGTITDIGKAAAPAPAPLVTVQTATSVNGYADPFSVLLRHGVKRTTPSRWPDVLVIDPAVLQDAPPDLNRAGAGDLMAMFTAPADWYLASAIAGYAPDPSNLGHPAGTPATGHPGTPTAAHPGDPPYHPAVAELVRARGPRLLELAAAAFPSSPYGAPASGASVPEDGSCALAELAGILTLSGIAMGVAGSTAPASGMEHAVSHLLEMAAAARGEPASFHGTQVGVASVVAARTWAHVLRRIADGGLGRPAALPDPDDVSGRIGRAFAAIDPSGAMAAECFTDYAKKLRRLGSGGDPLAALRASWPAHHEVMDGILTDPVTLVTALRTAGLPARFCDLAGPVDDETARWAVATSPLMRQRFCVADLAMLLGAWEDADVEAVLAGTTVGQR
jgi:glycerol-1-phosphate dehydrogenase [NAD(P)+]